MGKTTAIEWCDSTVNPMMGCSGCELWHPKHGGTCYAAELVNRYRGNKGYPEAFEEPTWFPERAIEAAKWSDLTGTDRPDKPWLNERPRHIFNVDMGDVFSKPLTFRDILMNLWAPMMTTEGRRHVWLVLTKRAKRAVEYEHWQRWTHGIVRPRNVMLMTSITSQATVKRLEQFRDLPEELPIGVSVEPLLEPVSLHDTLVWFKRTPAIDWVIVGAESGNSRRPMELDWVRTIRDECKVFGIPFFFKQQVDRHGKVKVPELDGQQWVQMPDLKASPLGRRPELGQHKWCQEIAG